MKKIVLAVAAAFISSCCSFAVGYSYGYSNMGGYYPPFSSYVGIYSTREEVGRYVDEAEEYIKACDYDMELILNARNDAVNSANAVIDNYNLMH